MGKYFTIPELTRSTTAAARGIDNTPPADVAARLERLIDKVLDPIRTRWGAPITVNSGYRSPSLNKAVGGVATSQHTKGEAADITTGMIGSNKMLFDLIRTMKLDGEIDFDQLIDEKGYTWIHISFADRNRGQILHL